MQGKFKIISLNLNKFNKEKVLFNEYIDSENPDIIFLFELTHSWAKNVSALNSRYPYAKAILQNDNFGVGILSRYPLENAQEIREPVSGSPAIIVTIKLEEMSATLIAAHPFPPIHAEGKKARDDYLEQLAGYAQESKSSVILCGDLNITPWSQVYKGFLKKSQLSIPKGYGVIKTWPTGLNAFGLPIDHCLTSQDIITVDYARGPDIGSDHYPIEMNFGFANHRLPAANLSK